MDGKRERKGGRPKVIPLKLLSQPSRWIKIVLPRMRSRRMKFCVQRDLRVLLSTSKRQAMCMLIHTHIACRICMWIATCIAYLV